jgi:D-glycero-D-manno-heptose 1,7-bisphosphate phosphatase
VASPSEAVRLLILDRDGVINQDSPDYVKSPDEWIPLDGSLEAIAALNRAGFTIAVASNQSGLARGYFDRDTLEAMHTKFRDLLVEAGGRVDRIEICPHGPDDGCDCRKPLPGLINRLVEHYAVDAADVIVVGDSRRDLEAAVTAGARPVLVRTGNGMKTESTLDGPLAKTPVFDSLAALAAYIEAQ